MAAASAALGQPANDVCTNATPIPFGGTLVASNVGATSDVLTGGCTQGDEADVWFTFTAPYEQGFTFSTRPTGDRLDTTITVWPACDAISGESLACSDDQHFPFGSLDASVDVDLLAGQSVVIRVASFGGRTGSFQIHADRRVFSGAAYNDRCENAQVVTWPSHVRGTSASEIDSDVSDCGSNDVRDVWYEFTAPETRQYDFFLTHPGLFAVFVGVWDGCDGTELTCGLQQTSIELAAGQRVLIRVAAFEYAASEYIFNVGPYPEYPVPDNASCQTPAEIGDVGVYAGTTNGALPAHFFFGGGPCMANLGPVVWYRFTAPRAGIFVFDTSDTTGMTDTLLAAFGSCDNMELPSGMIGCDNNLGRGDLARIVLGAEFPGASALIAVTGADYQFGDFVLNVYELPEPPANSVCDGAQEILLGQSLVQDNLNSAGTTTSSCDDFDFLATWFSFIAPVDGLYKIDTMPSTDEPYLTLSLYDDCGGAELACLFEPLGYTEATTFLAAGQRVLIRLGASNLAYVGIHVGPGPDPDVAGACCDGTACSIAVDEAACIASGGTYQGPGELCQDTDENPVTCCVANYDRRNGVGVADLFGFLDDWFATFLSEGPDFPADIDRSGVVNVADLFGFLDAWFVGCPR